MSKRRLIILGSLVLALILIFGVYYIITRAPKDNTDNGQTTQPVTTTQSGTETAGPDDTTTTARNSTLFDFLTLDIYSIRIDRRSGDAIRLQREKETRTNDDGTEFEYEFYVMAEPAGYVISQQKVSSFASAAAWIYESRYVGMVDDLSEFGLDKPEAVISVVLKNGEEHIIHIGDPTINNDGYYVTLPGTNDVSIIFKSKGDSLLIDIRNLLPVELFTFEMDDVTEYSIRKRGEDKIVIRKKSEEELKDQRFSFESYKVLEPLMYDANTANISQNLTYLIDAEIKEYIELEAADLSKYGLADPSYEVSIKNANGEQIALDIGNPTEDRSARYARFDGMNAVFTIPAGSLVLIDKPLKELVASFIYIVNIKIVDGVYFKAPGFEFEATIEHLVDESGSEYESFKVNGRDAMQKDSGDKEYFRTFYQSLLSVFTNSFDLTASPAYDPEVTIIYQFNDMPDVRVDYVRKDDFYFYTFIDGRYSGILVRNTDIEGSEKMLKAAEALLDNLD